MKYNTLISFKKWLAETLSPATADTYYKAVSFLLKDQMILDCRMMDIDSVLEKLEAMRYKSQYSKYVNAFLKFAQYLDIELSTEALETLALMKQSKIKKRRKLKPVKLHDIKNHVKVIRDNKLKLSFETILAGGFRVSELSQIRKEDCFIQGDSILFRFIGKGGKDASITLKNSQLVTKLTDLIISTPPGEKVFYSTGYLQAQARGKGFQCHDLRRAFAKLAYKEHKDIDKVMSLLRHTKKKNTYIYLKSKVDL